MHDRCPHHRVVSNANLNGWLCDRCRRPFAPVRIGWKAEMPAPFTWGTLFTALGIALVLVAALVAGGS